MSDESNKQGSEHQNLSGTDAQQKIAELVQGIHICTMTTVAKDGSIDARPMAVQQKPFDGTLWFLTHASSGKVDEIENDQHVTLCFAEPSDSKYITLKGRASVSLDRSKIKDLWNVMYKAWFPKGEDDPDIAVLRVDVHEGDYWEASSSKLLFFAKYAVAAATGGTVSAGTSGHVTV